MTSLKNLRLLILILPLIFLNSCNGKLPGADARKVSPDPAKRVEQNVEQGKGFRLMDGANRGGGKFEFARSNPL